MKNSIISARRIKGDLDLGFDPVRIFAPNGKALGEQFFDGGKLNGSTPQSIYETSTTQKYFIGTGRRQLGRIFRYSFAMAALLGLSRLVGNTNFEGGTTGHVGEDGFEGAPFAIANIGSNFIDIADTALRAADFYQGGLLVAFGVAQFHQYIVVHSLAGTGAKVRCFVSEPVNTENILLATGVTVYRSQYSAIGKAGDGGVAIGFMTFKGVNLVPVSISNYFWLQTAGPAIITPTVFPGQAVSLREVYVNPADGTIADNATLPAPHQRVGHLISATQGAPAAYGDLLVNLQLD